MPRTLLLVTPMFYPEPGVGSVRATNWARILAERGWTVHVAARRAGPPEQRRGVADFVHPDVVVHALDAAADGDPAATPAAGRPALLPRIKAAAKGLVPADIFVPDPSVVFWKPASARLAGLAHGVGADAVITTGPPHAVHLVGLAVAQRHATPWIADYRDPHLLDARFRPRLPILGRAHEAFERRVYGAAAAVTHAIELHHRWASRRHPEARDRCVFLPHFCPPDLVRGEVGPFASPAGRTSVRAVGFIGDDQALDLARAVRRMVDEDGVDAELRLAGRRPASAGAIAELLGDRAQIMGFVPHDTAKSLAAGADVLVAALSEGRAATVGISSKLYEYLATGRPVIVMNPTRPDRRLLRDVRRAHAVAGRGAGALADALRAALRSPREDPAADPFIERYSVERHADMLSGLLDRVVAARAGRPTTHPTPHGADG